MLDLAFAMAPPPEAAGQGGGSLLSLLPPMIMMFLIFYFILTIFFSLLYLVAGDNFSHAKSFNYMNTFFNARPADQTNHQRFPCNDGVPSHAGFVVFVWKRCERLTAHRNPNMFYNRVADA